MTELPDGWGLESLADLSIGGLLSDGDWVESKDQDPAGDVRLTQLADVGISTFRNRSDRWLRDDQAERLHCTFLEPGDILIARMPDPIGRACQVPVGLGRAVTVVDVAILRIMREDVDPRYVMWAINSPQVHGRIAALQSGTTRKRVSRRNLAEIQVPIPGLSEQRRIVDILEEHLSRLGAALGQLETARSRAERLVTSRSRQLITQCGGPLMPFSEVFTVLSDEGRRVAQRDYLADAPLPVVDQGAEMIGGYTGLENRFRSPGPVVVFGDHTRRVKFIDFDFAVGAQGVKVLKPRQGIDPRFAFHLATQADLPSRGYGRHFSLLRSSVFHIPDANTQDSVAREIDAMMEAEKRLRESLECASGKSERLRESLLLAAFSGRLLSRSVIRTLTEESARA